MGAQRKIQIRPGEQGIPKHLSWLTKTLLLAYRDRALVLAMVGDIAKLIAKRKKGPKTSSTTCIACGGWISKEREERRQHTCSDRCQDWYRRLTRAIDAEKTCRYCGHGMPKTSKAAVRRVRPARPQSVHQKTEIVPQKGYGAPRRVALKSVPVGGFVPLKPTGPAGRPFEDVKEQIEAFGQ